MSGKVTTCRATFDRLANLERQQIEALTERFRRDLRSTLAWSAVLAAGMAECRCLRQNPIDRNWEKLEC